jgi:uncharacterized LabA/DUF88 family protein
MADPSEPRVAVYIDFDNIVISRYDLVHGKGRFSKDKVRTFFPTDEAASADVKKKVAEATVDIGAVLDFASSFGTVAISRAYADWSVAVNASYRKQLIERAVDLVQLFPVVQSMKNGADIRLSVDVVEDLFRLPDLTHVVIVAGDSDYIALAQRCKKLGRYVIGAGVAGGTSRALVAACDEFQDYADLPGVFSEAPDMPSAQLSGAAVAPSPRTTSRQIVETSPLPSTKANHKAATTLLLRALRLGQAQSDSDWMLSSEVKKQMRRVDPTFNEASLGYRSFTEFVKSRNGQVEMDDNGQNGTRRIRIRPSAPITT